MKIVIFICTISSFLINLNLFACSLDSLRALSVTPGSCDLKKYRKDLGKITTHDGCNVFKKTLKKVREEKHEIPGKALFDTVKYLMNNFGKSPTEGMKYYKRKIGFLKRAIKNNRKKLLKRLSKSKKS